MNSFQLRITAILFQTKSYLNLSYVILLLICPGRTSWYDFTQKDTHDFAVVCYAFILVNWNQAIHFITSFSSLRPSDAYICVSKLTIIGSDNGLAPRRRQAIIWTNDGVLLIGPLGTNFSEITMEIHAFSKMHLKMSSEKWRPFCLGLNVLSSVALQHSHICSRASEVTLMDMGKISGANLEQGPNCVHNYSNSLLVWFW